MELDFATLDSLRQNHPAWRLLRADLSPLVLSFLSKTYIASNSRVHSLSELSEKLEDELFQLRAVYGSETFPRAAADYLDDWASDSHGWLRKYYPPAEDEPHFDLTPATEKAIAWVHSLTSRPFVGTESRLLTVFNLLKEIVEGSETDPERRVEELKKKAAEIKAEITRIKQGRGLQLDETALRDRFLQMSVTARDLLSDFREVEENFRRLDRHTRERIALWDSSKGDLLDDIFGEQDAINDSDQGRSFRAFWDFLLSAAKQDEFSRLLGQALELPAIASLRPDPRIRRVHYDWLGAGEHTQRTVSALSQQLRRFLDDRTWLENRRILEILKGIEGSAVALRDAPPSGDFMTLECPGCDFGLPMERPLFSPPLRVQLSDQQLVVGEEELDTSGLYTQVYVDRERLTGLLRQALSGRSEITLGELLKEHPLRQGLAELVTYLTLREDDFHSEFEETQHDDVLWEDDEGRARKATLPRLVFRR